MKRGQAIMLAVVCFFVQIILAIALAGQALIGSTRRAYNMAISIDQTANALLGGSPDETISARIHRNQWKKTETFVNWLFGDENHCKDSYESERTGAHLPGEYR